MKVDESSTELIMFAFNYTLVFHEFFYQHISHIRKSSGGQPSTPSPFIAHYSLLSSSQLRPSSQF
jgi:hypothetical protein